MTPSHKFRFSSSASLFGGSTTATAYSHEDTGATHYHFIADGIEKAFIVAFRTVPKDSSGVAHVLEQLVPAADLRRDASSKANKTSPTIAA